MHVYIYKYVYIYTYICMFIFLNKFPSHNGQGDSTTETLFDSGWVFGAATYSTFGQDTLSPMQEKVQCMWKQKIDCVETVGIYTSRF